MVSFLLTVFPLMAQLLATMPAAGVDPLTGLPADPTLAARNIVGVMVENTVGARPQSGLDSAGAVVESWVEGGVTRFMVLFSSLDAPIVGPVRSTRQHFASVMRGFDGYLGHAWAAYETGYGTIEKLHVRNLDGVRLKGHKSPYFRVEARKAPHDLYTTVAELRRLAKDFGYVDKPCPPLAPFKADQPAASPAVPWFGLDFNGRTYFAHFEYDAATNSYLRFVGGEPHKSGSERVAKPNRKLFGGAPHDMATAVQLHPKNVVVLVMKTKYVPDHKGPTHFMTPNMVTWGEGPARVFLDGKMVEGRWTRATETDPLRVVDAAGQPIALNRGQTWICLVGGLDNLVLDRAKSPIAKP